jgi:hypothetical protein
MNDKCRQIECVTLPYSAQLQKIRALDYSFNAETFNAQTDLKKRPRCTLLR